MSIPNYDVRSEYVGAGNQSQYSFDFKIASLNDIIIEVTDSLYNIIFKVDGNDTTFLSSVDFDSVNGGGFVNLASTLTIDYLLTIILAPDQPTQLSEFRNKASFTLRSFENALDALAGDIQRLAYLTKRSLKLDDRLSDLESFDTTIPIVSTNTVVQSNVGKTVVVGADNKSLALGPTAYAINIYPSGQSPLGPVAGTLAITSTFILAVYSGSAWVRASDGVTSVIF